MLSDAELAAIEERSRLFRLAVTSVVVGLEPRTVTVGTRKQGEALVAMVGGDIPRLLAEVRRLRDLADSRS